VTCRHLVAAVNFHYLYALHGGITFKLIMVPTFWKIRECPGIPFWLECQGILFWWLGENPDIGRQCRAWLNILWPC